MTADIEPKAIDLAAERDFTLGALQVHPSSREVVNGTGSEVLEPRVMQVLVVLAQRRGQVVSRDTLVGLCWAGRSIGEDAIQRAIAKLRKVGETTGAFMIETIARVGYRLKSVGGAAETVAAAPASAEPILAVLPFDNLSDDRDAQFFSDGMSEEILHTIARAQGLKVVGRTSAFQFRGTDKSVRKVSSELGATHVLDGSIRRVGNRIRIGAHLVEASSQTTVWSEQYDRDLSDVLRLQTEIAEAIAATLRAKLLAKEHAPSIDPGAYDLYLRARQMRMASLNDVHTAEVVSLLERAVTRAPEFARAWGYLAHARAFSLPRENDSLGTPAHNAALTAAETTIRLDASCGDAHAAFALLKPAFSGYAEKLQASEQAVALSPNDAWAHFVRGSALIAVGRANEELVHMRRAMELEPDSPPMAMLYGLALEAVGQMNEAIELFDDAVARFPNAAEIKLFKVLLLFNAGKVDEAERFLRSYSPEQLSMSEGDVRAHLLMLTAHRAPLIERIKTWQTIFDATAASPLWIGHCKFAAEAGCTDLAYEQLFRALETGRPIFAKASLNWGIPRAFHAAGFFSLGRPLRRDPRFARLCASLGLVDHWRGSAHWPDCAAEVPYDFKAECEKAAHEIAKT